MTIILAQEASKNLRPTFDNDEIPDEINLNDDDDDIEQMSIPFNNDDDDDEDEIALALQRKSTRKKKKMPYGKKRSYIPILIVALFIIVLAMVGLLLIYFLYSPPTTNDNVSSSSSWSSSASTPSLLPIGNSNNNNNNNNNSRPTLSSLSSIATTTTTTNPSSSPVATITTEEPVQENNLLSKLCPTNSNLNEMQTFLAAASTNNEVYMIEMLKFKNEQFYRDYMDYLTNDVLPNIDGAKLVFRMIQTYQANDEPDWDEVIIIKYPNGPTYLEKVLEQNNGIGDNADSEMIQGLLERRNAGLESSFVWAATLNTEVVDKYPELLVDDNGVVPPSTDLFFHAIKFKSPDGRTNVAKFDERTKGVKSTNEIYVQAWLDIRASCGDGGDTTTYDYDQIRIETLGNYALAIVEDGWLEGSRFRADGIEMGWISAFASNEISTNLYSKNK